MEPMESIAVLQPNLGRTGQERLALSPFGVLAQAFSEELLARAEGEEGRWPFVPLELLEERENAPPPAGPTMLQVDLHLVLEALQKETVRTERLRATERIVERILQRQKERQVSAPPAPAVRPMPPEPRSAPMGEPLQRAFYQTLNQNIRLNLSVASGTPGVLERGRAETITAPGQMGRQMASFSQILQTLREEGKSFRRAKSPGGREGKPTPVGQSPLEEYASLGELAYQREGEAEEPAQNRAAPLHRTVKELERAVERALLTQSQGVERPGAVPPDGSTRPSPEGAEGLPAAVRGLEKALEHTAPPLRTPREGREPHPPERTGHKGEPKAGAEAYKAQEPERLAAERMQTVPRGTAQTPSRRNGMEPEHPGIRPGRGENRAPGGPEAEAAASLTGRPAEEAAAGVTDVFAPLGEGERPGPAGEGGEYLPLPGLELAPIAPETDVEGERPAQLGHSTRTQSAAPVGKEKGSIPAGVETPPERGISERRDAKAAPGEAPQAFQGAPGYPEPQDGAGETRSDTAERRLGSSGVDGWVDGPALLHRSEPEELSPVLKGLDSPSAGGWADNPALLHPSGLEEASTALKGVDSPGADGWVDSPALLHRSGLEDASPAARRTDLTGASQEGSGAHPKGGRLAGDTAEPERMARQPDGMVSAQAGGAEGIPGGERTPTRKEERPLAAIQPRWAEELIHKRDGGMTAVPSPTQDPIRQTAGPLGYSARGRHVPPEPTEDRGNRGGVSALEPQTEPPGMPSPSQTGRAVLPVPTGVELTHRLGSEPAADRPAASPFRRAEEAPLPETSTRRALRQAEPTWSGAESKPAIPAPGLELTHRTVEPGMELGLPSASQTARRGNAEHQMKPGRSAHLPLFGTKTYTAPQLGENGTGLAQSRTGIFPIPPYRVGSKGLEQERPAAQSLSGIELLHPQYGSASSDAAGGETAVSRGDDAAGRRGREAAAAALLPWPAAARDIRLGRGSLSQNQVRRTPIRESGGVEAWDETEAGTVPLLMGSALVYQGEAENALRTGRETGVRTRTGGNTPSLGAASQTMAGPLNGETGTFVPLELLHGPVTAAERQPQPAPPPPGAPEESDYVRGLPDWARRFLRGGQGQPPVAREIGVARHIAALPGAEEETVEWTAPNYRPPAPSLSYREKGREEPAAAMGPPADVELQRTADKVYRMIEERIRRERRRLGL